MNNRRSIRGVSCDYCLIVGAKLEVNMVEVFVILEGVAGEGEEFL